MKNGEYFYIWIIIIDEYTSKYLWDRLKKLKPAIANCENISLEKNGIGADWFCSIV